MTVYENEHSQLALDTSRSRYLRYEGRDSKSIHTVQRKIGELLGRWSIERIALRVGLDCGQYRLSTLAYKLEAALQLLPELDLRSLTTTEVMGFGRSWDDYLPSPSGKLARKGDRQNQLNAIRTAALDLFQREGRI